MKVKEFIERLQTLDQEKDLVIEGYEDSMKDHEQKIINAKYGANAKPILIKDKSIAGLLAGNKCQKSKLTAWNILKLNLRP